MKPTDTVPGLHLLCSRFASPGRPAVSSSFRDRSVAVLVVIPEGDPLFWVVIPEGDLLFLVVIPEGDLLWPLFLLPNPQTLSAEDLAPNLSVLKTLQRKTTGKSLLSRIFGPKGGEAGGEGGKEPTSGAAP